MLEPNQFTLSGDDVQINYSTSSVSGQPHFNYKDSNYEATASGSDITTDEHSIGTLVTATVEQIPDLHTVTVTLVVPKVNLPGDQVAIETLSILSKHATSTGGPDLVDGQIQTYQVTAVEGKAQLVKF